MIVNLFNKPLGTAQAWPEPLIKANKVMIDNVEKMLLFQMNTLKSYCDIGINQLRAAAEITDPHSLQDFCKRQAEIVQTLQCKFMNDTRILSAMAAGFKTEIEGLTRNTLERTWSKAA